MPHHPTPIPHTKNTRSTNIDQYDATIDPQDHLDTFEASILFHGASDLIMCRAFPLTLMHTTLQWFTQLEHHNIDDSIMLANKFNI
ncbi:hypothetical protein Lal_00042301 [Lupinus albus]|nr:hypothetical protein Lal_00042301 [Lupinus albus]